MDAVQRADQLHAGEIFAAELWRHGLELGAVEEAQVRAIHGVQLDTFPGFKYRGAAYSLLDVYNSGAVFSQDSAGQE